MKLPRHHLSGIMSDDCHKPLEQPASIVMLMLEVRVLTLDLNSHFQADCSHYDPMCTPHLILLNIKKSILGVLHLSELTGHTAALNQHTFISHCFGRGNTA